MIADLKWLYAAWRLKRAYEGKVFSYRLALMLAARHPVRDDGGRNAVIDYPDAMMALTLPDVRRAIATAKSPPLRRKYLERYRPDLCGRPIPNLEERT